jgi:glucan phosphoethanolaminetransferase (alkaline phosphatase superfamily)
MNLRVSCDRQTASDSPGFGETARRSNWSLNGGGSVNIHSVHKRYLLIILCNFACMYNKLNATAVKYEIIKQILVNTTERSNVEESRAG